MEDGLLSALPPPLHPTLGHAAGMPRHACCGTSGPCRTTAFRHATMADQTVNQIVKLFHEQNVIFQV